MPRLCIVSVNFSEFPSQHIFLSFLSPGRMASRPRDVVPCPPNPSADPHQRGLETDQWEGKPGANRHQHSSQPEPLGSGDTVTWNVHEEKDLQIHTQGRRESERMDWLLTKKGQNVLCASYSNLMYKLDSEMRRNAIHNTSFCNLSVSTSGAIVEINVILGHSLSCSYS